MIAYRIEEMCAHYNSSIILSEQIQRMVSDKGKNTLRLIDKVVMNESQLTPREIYSYDIKFTDAIDNLPLSKVDEHDIIGGLVRTNNAMVGPDGAEIPKIKIVDTNVDQMYIIDYDFQVVKNQKKEAFENNFRLFYQNYRTGEWPIAQNFISICLDVPTFNEDGPCVALSEFMERHKNKAPDDWEGFRNIDEKDAEPSMSFMNNDDDF